MISAQRKALFTNWCDILQEEVRLSFAVDVVLPDSGECLVVWVE